MFGDNGGYYIFPNGLIMQWGKISQLYTNENMGRQGKSSIKYSFPIPFTHSCLSLCITNSLENVSDSHRISNKGTGVFSYDKTGFYPFIDLYESLSPEDTSAGLPIGCHWFAIGY